MGFASFALVGGISNQALGLIVALAVSVAVSTAVFFAARRIVRRSRVPALVVESVEHLFKVPVAAAIIGVSLMEAVRLFSISLPFLTTAEIVLAIELVVIAIAVRSFGVVAKKMTRLLTGHKEADRVLLYGIYAIGIVALVFVFLSSPVSPTVASGVWQMVGFGVGLVVVYLATYIANMSFKKYADLFIGKDPHAAIVITFARRLAVIVIALVGVAVVTFVSFPSAGAAVASLFVAAGFASIVIGLAAQSSLANIFAGIIVSTSRPFEINDAVLFQMPWGAEWCWVEDVRTSFTILKTWDKRRLVIPNQLFLTTPLVNYNLVDESKLCIVFIQVPYEADLDTVIRIMKEEAAKHPSFVPVSGLPIVHVMEYDESGVQLRLLSNAPDQGTNFQMSKDLLYSIRKRLMDEGISVQYPRREVVFKDVPPGFFGGDAGPQPAKRGSAKKP